MKDAAEHVGIGHAHPLQREHLKVSLQHVGVEGGELERAHVDVDADLAQILLNDRGLQAEEFIG